MTDSKHRSRLITLLQELFQLDKPELDFGLYKIMHARADRVSQFLQHDLLAEIEAAFGEADGNRIAEAKAAYDEKLQQAKDLGAPDPEQAPAVKEAKAAYQSAKDGGNSETDIYDHLYRFFERYYDKGDFMSRRYYARESDSRAAPYAVPYDGREVYLHWANKDQYYIKSSDYLTNYSFDLSQAVKQLAKQHKGSEGWNFDTADTPLKVHFRIVDGAEGEHGNVKEANDNKRLFVPFKERPAETNADGELVLNFQYKTLPGGQYAFDEAAIKQHYGSVNKGDMPHYWMADAFLAAIDALDDLPAAYGQQLRALAPTDKQKKRPLLVKYLNKYASRHSMDYFIHKDLGGFLRRELDFYIKNEIMQLDAIDQADAPKVESYLAKIKVLRRIAHQLIDFLAQLENFQKKLWLKKKFVTETNYGITLDRVPESLYPEIAASNAQREEWCELFHIQDLQGDLHTPAYSDPLSVDFLKANPFLVLDTKHFSADFKARLISEIDGFDEQCDGLLVHSENFQALNLHKTKHKECFNCIYIDPPYNTGPTEIIYYNSYKDSSWLSLIADRLSVSLEIMSDSACYSIAIDDFEMPRLCEAVDQILNGYDRHMVIVNHHPQGGMSNNISRTHEYMLMMVPSGQDVLKGKAKTGQNELRSFMLSGPGDNKSRHGRPNSFYAILVDPNSNRIVGLEPPPRPGSSYRKEDTEEGYIRRYPISPSGHEKVWCRSYSSALEGLSNNEITITSSGVIKLVVDTDGKRHSLMSNWTDSRYNAGPHGTGMVANIMGYRESFSYPKSLFTVIDSIEGMTWNKQDPFILDYFAGSGTTAHAIIALNRSDLVNRKYALVEMGNYFDTVLKPRIAKVVYSENWKNGKPVPPKDKKEQDADNPYNGLSHCFKYIRLESYEDALNNLTLRDNVSRDKALENNDNLRRDYLLNYFLDVETQGSQSLLNVDAFRNPTAYSMQIKQPGSDEAKAQPIDLVETFNWLIGLWVEHLAAPQTFAGSFEREKDPQLPEADNTRLLCKRLKPDADGDYWFRLVEGYTLKVPGDTSYANRQKTLIVWRKLTDDAEKDNAALQRFLNTNLNVRTRDQEYHTIYINGSHTLPNPVVDGEKTKVRLLEEAFHTAMWSEA